MAAREEEAVGAAGAAVMVELDVRGVGDGDRLSSLLLLTLRLRDRLRAPRFRSFLSRRSRFFASFFSRFACFFSSRRFCFTISRAS